MNRYPLRRQLPHGVKDLFLEDAARVTWLEERLRALFPRWGYTPIIPPTFEYYDSYAAGADAGLREQMYRLFDRDGRTLALRPDLTVPTARIVGTKLYDQPLPLRFYYIANVFRFEEPQAGRQREFTQAGVELIGAATPEADAEVLALAVEALRTVGLADFRISLGQMAYFRALLAGLDLAPEAESRLRTTVDQRNVVALEALLDELEITGPARAALAALPQLVGGPEVLGRAQALAPDGGARAALEHLRRVYAILDEQGIAAHIQLDLGEVRGMEYYTGITFEGFVRGLGFSVCNGGRYDDLIGRYGEPLPAVGWALGVERVLLALERQGTLDVHAAPETLVAWCDHRACHDQIAQWRREGRRVEVDVLQRSETELLSYAAQRGIPHVLACTGPGTFQALRSASGVEEG